MGLLSLISTDVLHFTSRKLVTASSKSKHCKSRAPVVSYVKQMNDALEETYIGNLKVSCRTEGDPCEAPCE
jgi:hypothetical protein